MKGLSILDMNKALGKLLLKREEMLRRDSDYDTKKIDGYILQLRKRIKKA